MAQSDGKLQLSVPTHLLIHQVPSSETELKIDDARRQVIPVFLRAMETNSNGNDSEKGTVPTNEETERFPDQPATSSTQILGSCLEDFIDIITTYKCKFCPFSCAWKSGLMSHIQNTHMSINKVTPPSMANSESAPKAAAENVCEAPAPALEIVTTDEDSKQYLTDEHETANENKEEAEEEKEDEESYLPPAQEKQIFLCGECSQGFINLNQCKLHMIQEHEFVIESDESKPPVKKKKNHVLKKKSKSETSPVNNEANDSISKTKVFSKRKIRAPKALEQDYVLSKKRRRIRLDPEEDRTFRCKEKGCSYRFKLEKSLSYHERCHSPGGRHFVCPECNEKSNNWRILSIHLWKVHKLDTDLYCCPGCSYRTYSLFKLENHQRIHSDERSFVCLVCGKGFKQVSQLRNHSVIHMDRKNMSEKRWYSEQKCDICNRTFSDSKCLRKHLQAVHNKLKPFVCTFCGHASARKAMLDLHLRQHTGEKPFQCDQCDYRTGDHNSLRRHKMRHTGLKPYKCPHCLYACIQAISYKTHLKNKHPGMEGLYACNLCSFRSVSKDNYINHIGDHKRGAIPITNSTPIAPAPTLGQIEGVLPNNIATAQLIYSCLNALSQDSHQTVPTDGSTTTSTDGTQTITIQIPNNQEVPDMEQYYLTIQHPTELMESAIGECEPREQTFTLTTTTSDDAAMHVGTDVQSIHDVGELEGVHLIPVAAEISKPEATSSLSLPLVITQSNT